MIGPKTISYFYLKIRSKSYFHSKDNLIHMIFSLSKRDFYSVESSEDLSDLLIVKKYLLSYAHDQALNNIKYNLYYPKCVFREKFSDLIVADTFLYKYICFIIYTIS